MADTECVQKDHVRNVVRSLANNIFSKKFRKSDVRFEIGSLLCGLLLLSKLLLSPKTQMEPTERSLGIFCTTCCDVPQAASKYANEYRPD